MAISPPILDEYRRVVAEMTKKRPISVLAQILELIELRSEVVTPARLVETVCSDPDDDKFLATALAAAPITLSAVMQHCFGYRVIAALRL